MPRPSLLVTRKLPEQVELRLAKDFDVTTNESDRPLSRSDLLEAMRRFDALSPTITDRIDTELIATAGATVRIIANFGAGFEHIDLAAARTAHIMVTNTPDALTDATAEIATLLMLMTARRAGEGERELRAGNWTGWRPTHLLGQGLYGKTLGLVGFGRIAKATSMRAAALGMRILYYSRSESPDAGIATYVPSIGALAEQADVLSLHVPSNASTHHLVNEALLARMKSTAILVNTARGAIVDELALARALSSRSIAGAGLDVYEAEPIVHPALLACDNVVLLPHLGSATIETRVSMGMQMADNLDAFFAGREPPNRVA